MDEQATGTGAWSGRSLGRFTILEPIGRGGMGEVYRGWDDRLKRPVAIKSLKSSLAQNDRARARFVRETRYACRVDHPYVATVFDVVEDGRDVFLVMELIEGRRLDRAIEQDAPAPSRIVEWGIEIGEALVAIHGSGLVHRDLKPGNVLVTSSGHVKVMDFGVAFSTAGRGLLASGATPGTRDSTLTEEGVGVGTVAYMSPEQVRGMEVDARSDLFSLGIVLYEAVTREHPFARSSIGATVSAILHDPPGGGTEPPTLTQSGPLRDVVFRLLEKDPDLRYTSSEDVVADLRAVARGEAVPRRPPKPRRWRTWIPIAAAVAALAAVGLVGAWRMAVRSRSIGQAEARPTIAVLPFEDRTGEADGRDRGEMLADLLAAELGDNPGVRPVGRERLEPVLAGLGGTPSFEDALTAVEKNTSARYVVGGRLHKEGESYHAAVDIYPSGSKTAVASFTIGAGSVVALVDLARVKILDLVAPGARRASSGSAWAPRVEEAALLETQARRAIREIRYLDAIALLEKALALDSEYLPAAVAYARVLDSAGYGKRAVDAAAKALRLAQRPGAPGDSRWLSEARAADAEIHDRLDQLMELRRGLAGATPDDPEVWLALASACSRAGKPDEGLTAVERVVALDPTDPRGRVLYARLALARGKSDVALQQLAIAERLVTKLGSVLGLAVVLRERGDLERKQPRLLEAKATYQEAERRYREAAFAGGVARAQFDRAAVALDLGLFAEAESLFDAAIDSASRRGDFRRIVDSRNALGASLYSRGKNKAGEGHLRDALADARRLDNQGLALGPMLNLASLLAHTGRAGESRILAAEALAIAQERGKGSHEVMARLLLADAESQAGGVRESIEDYEAADALSARLNVGASQRFWTLDYLTEALNWTCAIDRALQTNATSLELADKSQQRELRAYALLRRAELRASLADWPAAQQDLDSAEALVGSGDETLSDLKPRVALARGEMAVMTGRPAEAEPILRGVIAEGQSSEAEGVQLPARTLRALVALELGQAARGIRDASSVLTDDRATAPERVSARVVLARCLAAAGRFDDAAREGRAAFDEASGMGLPLRTAEAASVLLAMPPGRRPADTERIRAQGLDALRSCDSAVPEDRRGAYRKRIDLRWMFDVLDARDMGGTAK